MTKDLETQSGCTQILPPDGRQDDTIKKTLTKTSTKTNNYGKQQQKHVGQDSPRSNHHSYRYRHHLRGDIVHGALASLHRRILRKINKYPHCPFLQGGDILYAQNMAEKNKLKEE